MSKLGPISHFLSPVSCDVLLLQGLRYEWGAGVLNLVLSLSLSHTGHWKFNMAPHGKELSEDLKKRIVALHKDGVGYKKIAKTLKLSSSTVAKIIQWHEHFCILILALPVPPLRHSASCYRWGMFQLKLLFHKFSNWNRVWSRTVSRPLSVSGACLAIYCD